MRKRGFWLKAPLLLLGVQTAAALAQKSYVLPGKRLHPESMATDGRGMAYVANVEGGVLRVRLATGKVERWIKPGAFGSASTFGVLVDPVNKLLWTCNNDLTAQGYPVEGGDSVTTLKGFDLATGKGKVSLPLPGQGAFCNDMTVARDGKVYVGDSGTSHILRWTPGAKALEDWFFDARFFAPEGGGLDGIAIGGDGHIYINNWRSNQLARVPIKPDGAPGAMQILELSRPIAVPDGLRLIGGLRFVMAEGGGRISIVAIKGDRAEVTTLVDGLSSPTGVGISGKAAWYVQGEMSYVFNAAKRGQTPPLPFRLASAKLP